MARTSPLAHSSGYFVSHDQGLRQRRSSDAARLIAGLALLGWGALTVDSPWVFGELIQSLAESAPTWSQGLSRLVVASAALYTIALGIGILWLGRASLSILRDILVALGLAAVVASLASQAVSGIWPDLFPESGSAGPATSFPVFGLAIITALFSVISPHLTRPMRRANLLMILATGAAALSLGVGTVGAVLGGFGVGIAASAVVLMFFGSPSGQPDLEVIRDAVKSVGVTLDQLSHRADDSWGVRYLDGVSNGRNIEVKAVGRDATAANLGARYWRALWNRGTAKPSILTRTGSVEHEAIVTMFAGRAGVSVPEVLAISSVSDDVALIVLDRPGSPLASMDAAEVSDELLGSLWEQIALMADNSIVHGEIGASQILVSGNQATLTGFSAGSLDPVSADGAAERSISVSRDLAGCLVCVANIVGVDRTIRTARESIGNSALEAALPFLQPPLLERPAKAQLADPKVLFKSLSSELAEALEIEVPPKAKIRRVNWKTLLMLALVLVAMNALLGLLGGIDFVAVWEIVKDASWGWILAGFLTGTLVFFPEATGMLFAVGHPLPLRPLVVLQVSVKFIGLAVPSAAGRIAMNAAFLRKYGVSPTVAVSQGAVDGLGGFVVEFGILLLALAAGDFSFDLSSADLAWGIIVLIVVVIGVIAVTALFRIKRIRASVLPPLKEALGLFSDVLHDPRRAAGVLGSNAASRMVLGIVLWMILTAVGAPLPLVVALVITVATNLLAGLVPIPGGVGVAEATLTALLVMAGLEQDVAFAAAVTFRVATFYIPAVAGFFATSWLEARDYL